MSWPTVALKEESSVITKGTTPTSLGHKFTDDGVPFLRAQNLLDGTISVEADPLYISEETNNALKRSKIQPNDVLISIAGTIGRAAIVPSGAREMNCNQAVAIVRPSEKVNRRFLLHWLSSQDAISQVSKGKVTGVISNLSLGQIGQLKIPLPPLDEQKRIAVILDQADALRRLRQRAIDRLDVLGKAWFDRHQRSLRGENTTLGEVCAKITDGTHQSPKWATSGVPFLFVSNIRNQEINFETEKFISEQTYDELTKNTKVEPGDVLYTSVGSYGHAAVVPEGEKFLFQRHIAHLKPNPDIIDSHYLMYLLESPSLRHQADVGATGIAQKTVTLNLLKRMDAIIPPLSVQKELAAKLKKMSERKITYLQSLSSLNELFASLQSRAFKGEL